MGLAAMLGTALAIAYAADKFARKDAAFLVAGALTAPIEGVIRDLNIPVLSPALAAYPSFPAGQENILGTGPMAGLSAWAGGFDLANA